MNLLKESLKRGIITQNPTFVLVLGMCPTLAVTTSVSNGIGMGLSTMAVLAFSNLFISLLRKFIPKKVRIASYIVIIASFVTIVQLLLEAYIPSLYKSLGIFIPLIVVNCVIFARAEVFASKNGPLSSFLDGIGMGLGFTAALTILSAIRQFLGEVCKIGVITLPPGGFLILALVLALFGVIEKKVGERRDS